MRLSEEKRDFYEEFGDGMLERYVNPEHEGNYYFGLRRRDELVGVGCLEHYFDGVGLLSKLLVRPDVRRQGIGRTLVEDRIRYGYEALGIKDFYSFVMFSNHASLAMLLDFGFLIAGIFDGEIQEYVMHFNVNKTKEKK